MLKNKLIVNTLSLSIALSLGVALPVFAETAETEAGASVEVRATTGAPVKIVPRIDSEVRMDAKAKIKAEMEKKKADLEMRKEKEKEKRGSMASSTESRKKEKMDDKISSAKERAIREIDRRIEGLMKLEGRAEFSKTASTSDKFDISATVQAEIKNFTDLRAKISADTDAETLKTDIASINKSYRIYALVIPQGQIKLAASKLVSAADAVSALSVKLEARINEAKTAGKDVSALTTALVELNAKVADARVQAAAAISLTASLSPDNGDEAVFQANKKALAEAKAKVELGGKSVRLARKSADTIVRSLKQISKTEKIKVEAKTETTVSGEASQ